MEPWKKYKIPTASKLFWMIPHEEETTEEVDISKSKIYLKYSFFKLPTIQDTKTIDRRDDYSLIESSPRVRR
jgi:hypothetical protein